MNYSCHIKFSHILSHQAHLWVCFCSFYLHLLSTKDDQTAHLRPHIMVYFFKLSFKKTLPPGAGAPGYTIVPRLPLTATKKLQHNHRGLSDTVKPLLHILKPQPAHLLQLYVYINCHPLYTQTEVAYIPCLLNDCVKEERQQIFCFSAVT